MAGHSVTLTHHCAAPPASVWAVLTDIDRFEDTLSGVTRVERLTSGPYAAGSRWRETRTLLGRAETQELWVGESTPPVRTVVNARSGGVAYSTDFTIAGDGTGSLITVTFAAVHPGANLLQRAAWAVFGPIGNKATTSVLRRDLMDIAAAAERRRP